MAAMAVIAMAVASNSDDHGNGRRSTQRESASRSRVSIPRGSWHPTQESVLHVRVAGPHVEVGMWELAVHLAGPYLDAS